jgi:hypothetical protein
MINERHVLMTFIFIFKNLSLWHLFGRTYIDKLMEQSLSGEASSRSVSEQIPRLCDTLRF